MNNIYLNGVRIAALNEGGGTAYYLTDQVDSVSTVLDDEGKTLSRIQYQPYGETFVHKGDTDFSPKYNSQELDKETNFYFYNARYYDPAVARFTSADTVIDGQWDTQGWNRYSYVKGNPIRYKDPTGHMGAGPAPTAAPAPTPSVSAQLSGAAPVSGGLGGVVPKAPSGGGINGLFSSAASALGGDGGAPGLGTVLGSHLGKEKNGVGKVNNPALPDANKGVVVETNGVGTAIGCVLGLLPGCGAGAIADFVLGALVTAILVDLGLDWWNSRAEDAIGADAMPAPGSGNTDETILPKPDYPVPTVPGTGVESPGEGWEWKGKPGSKPGDKDGSWHRPDPGESLWPDLDHPEPIGPHWDWKDPSGKWWRIKPNGEVTPK